MDSWSCGLVLKAQSDGGKRSAVRTPYPPQSWEKLDLAVFAFFLLVALRGHSMGKR